MNRKGFTLIELIAVIALLAIIATISFISINSVIQKSKISDCENLMLSIKSAVKMCVSDHRYDNVYGFRDCKTSNDLINGKYLTGPLKNPFDNKEEIDATIDITLNNADRTVNSIDVKIMDKNGNVIMCE